MMSGGVWGTVRAEAARLFGVSQYAITSGRFFTRWSALGSFLVGSLLLVPTIGEPTATAYILAVVVAMLGWTVLLIPGLTAVLLERTISAPAVRAVIVIVAITVIAAARPFVNDHISMVLVGQATGGDFVTRVCTNLMVAFPMFTLIAVITTQFSASSATAIRLDAALRRVEDARGRVDAFVMETGRELEDSVATLRAEREEMLAGEVSFVTVRDYSERVRAASHRLDARARVDELAVLPAVDALPDLRPVTDLHPPLLSRLGPTPWLVVGAVYYFMCVPVIVSHDRPLAIIGTLIGALAVDLLAGAAIRTLSRGLGRSGRGAIFVACWTLAGLALVCLGGLLIPGLGFLGVIPVVSTPVVAVIVALSIDAYRRALRTERRATRTLATEVQHLAVTSIEAHAPLDAAIALLHGGVQGRCVILAAQVDEEGPTPDAVARFRRETEAAFDAILRLPAADEAPAPLADLLNVWGHVIDVDADITSEAQRALADTDLAHAASEVVNEALVNAVKHSGARSARIALTTSEAGTLRIRVASPGVIARTTASGRGLRSLRGHVELTQSGDEVILTARLPDDAARTHESAAAHR